MNNPNMYCARKILRCINIVLLLDWSCFVSKGLSGCPCVSLNSHRKTLHSLMGHYFRSDEGGERSVCLAFGFLSLLVAMLVLVVREDYLEFGLEPGMSTTLTPTMAHPIGLCITHLFS